MSQPPPDRLSRLRPALVRMTRAPGAVLRRFPLPSVAAAVGMVILLRAVPDGTGIDAFPPVALGIPLLLALRLAGERALFPRKVEIVLSGAVIALLAALHVAWPGWSEPVQLLRFGMLFVAAHLLVAVLPFARNAQGFRPFNRHLYLRVLEGAFQAGVLMIGISVALLAVDRLFGVSVPGDTYLRLAVVLLLGFLPLHVLSGVTFSPEREDPRALHVLGRFILVPLSSLYLLILTAYLVQVLVTRSWPSGWIGWLVAWMGVVGTLSVLLVRPADPSRDRWAWWWERIFWVLMVPAAGMFLAALGKRIGQYGVTEPRYLGVVLGGWLAAVALGYGLLRMRDLRILPASLALVLLLAWAGPWGMVSVSRESQVNRLAMLLAAPDAAAPESGAVQALAVQALAADALATGALAEEAGAMESSTGQDAWEFAVPVRQREVHAVLTYLFRTHPDVDLSGVMGAAWDAEVSTGSGPPVRASTVPESGHWSSARADAAMVALGFDPSLTFPGGGPGMRSLARRDAGGQLPVSGFDRLYSASLGELTFEGMRVELRMTAGPNPTLEIARPGGEAMVSFDLSELRLQMAALDGDQSSQPTLEPRQPREVDSDALSFEGEFVGDAPGAGPLHGLRIRVVLDRVFVEAVPEGRGTEDGGTVGGAAGGAVEGARGAGLIHVQGPIWILVRGDAGA
ncbi:MAG: DUF4153 domain-containing protein [Gemmatimonadales bacterium]|nr:MAG: DUF4153 domain-containing protein [Gemmatimonadales bacterium]